MTNEDKAKLPELGHNLITVIRKLTELPERIPSWTFALMMRAAIFLVFFQSARTKVEGLITLKESTFQLFQYEYALPFVPYKLAAYMATYAEHTFSILILLGLATRLSATALLVMTGVIEIFVYPEAYVVHLTWASMLVYLLARGGGHLSLDSLVDRHFAPNG